jgi:phosphatidylserine decarboxylase
MLVAVAAVLVASIRLSFLDTASSIRAGGPRKIPVNASIAKGAEMGWFEHGSTIVMLAPPGFEFADPVDDGHRIRAGEALFVRQPHPQPNLIV